MNASRTGGVARRAPSAITAVTVAAVAVAITAFSVYAQGDLTMLDETVEGPYALAGTLHVTDPGALDLRVVIDYEDPETCYAITLTGDAAGIERIVDGTATAIGSGRAHGGFEANTDLELTVRRDGWRIELIVDREVLARACDSTLFGGQVGYTVFGGELPDPMVQPLGGVFMTDDFMRTGESGTTWEPVTGTWKTQALRVDEQRERMEAEKSANAFSYLGSADDGPAIACAGYWFWSNYAVSAAVRAAEAEPLGLVAYFQDAENYLALRWTSAVSEAPDADRLQLVSVVDGERAVLAEAPGGHLPGQWYRVELRTCEGLIEALVDDEPRLVAEADLFGQGQPGLMCEGEAGTFFDSVRVEPWEVLADDFSDTLPGRWVERSGAWTFGDGVARAEGERALAVTGRSGWERYAWQADLRSEGSAVGLAACVSEDTAWVLRIGAVGCELDFEGQAQIARVDADGVEVLAGAPAHVPAGTWHHARLVVDDGLLTGWLDGKRILDAFDADAIAGRVGLYAAGGAGAFDDVYLSMLPPMRIARVAKEFAEGEQHWEMAEWASTRAPWLEPAEEGGTWWTKGDYFGDKTIELQIPGVTKAGGELRLTLDAGEDGSGGYTLVVASEEGSSALSLTLLDGEETVADSSVEVQSDPCPLRFERKGTWIVVTVDGAVVLNEKR